MSGDATVHLPMLPPGVEVLVRALILAEEENAPDIGVDHLLAALESLTAEGKAAEPSPGPFVPAPHRDRPLSSQAKSAIEAAGAFTLLELENLTVDSLRTALLAARRDEGPR